MNSLLSPLLRALGAVVLGALLVFRGEQMLYWLVMGIGVVLLISGVVAVATWWTRQRTVAQPTITVLDSAGRPLTPQQRPFFPVAAVGGLVLGAVMAFQPSLFISSITTLLALLLIVAGLGQFFTLAVATRFARVGLVWWLLPAAVLVVGLVALFKPMYIATAPLLVMGWCMIVYGVVDTINAIKVRRCRKAWERTQYQEISSTPHHQTATAHEDKSGDDASSTRSSSQS